MARRRLVITVRDELVQWMDHHVATGRFVSRSHAVEYALTQAMDREMRHRPAQRA